MLAVAHYANAAVQQPQQYHLCSMRQAGAAHFE